MGDQSQRRTLTKMLAAPHTAMTSRSFHGDVPGMPLKVSTEATIRWRIGKKSVNVAIPDQQAPITGTLTFFDNQVDAATGTIALKATFANDDTRLWPGQFVNVTLTLGVEANAVVAPNAAIQIGQNGPYVFVIKDDSTVELRLVRTSRAVGNRTVIAEGLAAGERLVVDGQLRLANGSRVNVQRSEAPKAPAPVAER